MKDTVLYDSQTTFQGGMQNGFDPGHVAEHQYYRGINITCREGVIDSRPSFDKKNLDFSRLTFSAETVAEAQQNYDNAVTAEGIAQAVYDSAAAAQTAAQNTWNAFIATYDADRQTLVDEKAVLQAEYDQMVQDNIDQEPDPWTQQDLDDKQAEIDAKQVEIDALDQQHADLYGILTAATSSLSDASDALIVTQAETSRTYGILQQQFDAEWIFYNGKFQGSEVYKTAIRTYTVAVISGHVFMINLDNLVVTVLTTKLNKLSELVDRCYFVQAENYFIIQDGIARAKVLEGATIRDSDSSVPEIPVGTNMAYGHGRIAVQVSKSHFEMGDLFLAYDPSNVLKFRETQYLNEGGGFTVSGGLGEIISLRYANVSDTSTGDGPLLAICDNGFSTFAVNNPRINWSNISMQKVQLFGTGIVGPEAAVNINEDILYRSYEGIRSYAVGRSEAASAYKYTELSREVEPYMQVDRGHGAEFLSMAFFDKRMLATTAPLNLKAKMSNWQERKDAYDADPTDENERLLNLAYIDDVCFRGIIAFDFSMAGFTKSSSDSQYTRATTGSYDGIWTGIRSTKIFTAIVSKRKRCFSFVKDKDGLNALYEITSEVTGRDNGSKKIEQSIELRAMPFKTQDTYVTSPFVHKHLKELTLWIGGVEDEVDISVYTSSDVVDSFAEIGNLRLLAKTSSPNKPKEIGAPQSRSMLRLKMLKEIYDETTKHPVRNGYEFQFRINWKGRMRLRRLLAESQKIDDPTKENIETSKKTYPFDTFDQYAYESDL